MVIFGVETEKESKAVDRFYKEVDEKLQGDNLVKNPFIGYVRRYGLVAVVKMHPVYPRVYWFGLLSLVLSVFFRGFGWSWWHLPGFILLGISFFWSRYCFYTLLLLGLKKKGYRGKVKLLRDQYTINRVVTYGAD